MLRTDRYIAVFAILAIMLTGCNSGTSEKVTGRIAVIDLDRIAADIGRDKVMDDKVKSFIQVQQDRVNKLRSELRKNIEAEEKKLGKKPKKSEKEDLAKLTQQYELKLRQEIALAERDAKQLRAKLVREFREEIQAIATKIAATDGFSVVYIKQPAMLYIDPDVDISRVVVSSLQKGSGSKQ